MSRLPMGKLEARVMEVLWEARDWLSPGDVRRVLAAERDIARTTVTTILVRLWQKGRLERERRGQAFVYRPTESREAYAAARMQGLLASAKDRSAALSHFVEELSPAERAELRHMLQGLPEQ